MGWKKADYFWLAITIFSLVSYAAQSRQFIAGLYKDGISLTLKNGRYQVLKQAVTGETTEVGICGLYLSIREAKPALPEPEWSRQVEEYRSACDWIRDLDQALPPVTQMPTKELSWKRLPTPPNFTRAALIDARRSAEDNLAQFNEAFRAWKDIEDSTHKSAVEEVASVLAPIALACGLALRLAKVTGEIRLERLKSR
jgi:hypothetical protein